MCGRFYVDIDEKELNDIVNEVDKHLQAAKGEVYPTNMAAVLAPDGGRTAMRWGFSRTDGKGVVINARSETVADKYMFRQPFRTGRCLIPSSWYFEWEKRGAEKIKYTIRDPGSGNTWLAGISAYDGRTGISSFVILTRPAWEGIAFIHDRMPVILPPPLHDEWLNGRDPMAVIARSTGEVKYTETGENASS